MKVLMGFALPVVLSTHVFASDGVDQTSSVRDSDAVLFNHEDGSTEQVSLLEFLAEEAESNFDPGYVGDLGDFGENIIGADDRTRITATRNFPFRTHGTLAPARCTGTLIGPRHVLTAAHCVYSLMDNDWKRLANFAPGQNELSFPFGLINVKYSLAFNGYTVKRLKAWDIALVILEADVGERVGWMSYGYDDSYGPSHKLYININGYPGDKSDGQMWHSECYVQGYSGQQFTYPCDTYSGMSGSALYRYKKNIGERMIFGVHTNGGTELNSGTRINRTVFLALKKLKNEN